MGDRFGIPGAVSLLLGLAAPLWSPRSSGWTPTLGYIQPHPEEPAPCIGGAAVPGVAARRRYGAPGAARSSGWTPDPWIYLTASRGTSPMLGPMYWGLQYRAWQPGGAMEPPGPPGALGGRPPLDIFNRIQRNQPHAWPHVLGAAVPGVAARRRYGAPGAARSSGWTPDPWMYF